MKCEKSFLNYFYGLQGPSGMVKKGGCDEVQKPVYGDLKWFPRILILYPVQQSNSSVCPTGGIEEKCTSHSILLVFNRKLGRDFPPPPLQLDMQQTYTNCYKVKFSKVFGAQIFKRLVLIQIGAKFSQEVSSHLAPILGAEFQKFGTLKLLQWHFWLDFQKIHSFRSTHLTYMGDELFWK